MDTNDVVSPPQPIRRAADLLNLRFWHVHLHISTIKLSYVIEALILRINFRSKELLLRGVGDDCFTVSFVHLGIDTDEPTPDWLEPI